MPDGSIERDAAEVRSLERENRELREQLAHQGRGHRTTVSWLGGCAGAGGGLALGIIASVWHYINLSHQYGSWAFLFALIGVPVGGLVGAVVGAVVGFLLGRYRRQ